VIVSSEEGLPRLHGRADRAQGYQRDVAVSVSQYGLVPAILAATDLVCSLPQEFLACHTGQLDISTCRSMPASSTCRLPASAQRQRPGPPLAARSYWENTST
jgi:hypothetical protein